MSGRESPIEALSAVTLCVADMSRAVAFYEALGFERLYGGADAPFTSYAAGDGYVNLVRQTPPGAFWGRAILYVRDVDAMHARALAAGFEPEAPPADAPWGERYFHLRDPDGNELSFARPLSRTGVG